LSPGGRGADRANRITHIFGHAGHNLNALVAEYGSPEGAFDTLERETAAAVQLAGVSGVFEVEVRVGSFLVTVRGFAENGLVRIGTAFIP
jgi:hypothetical protein